MGNESCIKSGIEVRTAMIQDKRDITVDQNYEVESRLKIKPLALIYYNVTRLC